MRCYPAIPSLFQYRVRVGGFEDPVERVDRKTGLAVHRRDDGAFSTLPISRTRLSAMAPPGPNGYDEKKWRMLKVRKSFPVKG